MSSDLTNTVPCNLCGSSNYTVLFQPGAAQRNQIVRCNQCGLMYANPRHNPDIVEIESWPDDPNWDFVRANPQRYEKEQLQVRDYAETRASLNRLYAERGMIVEIGSSLGFLLRTFAADGWHVLGVEPDRHAAHFANTKQGITTINSGLDKAGIKDSSVDVVIMLHVIEHVPDPVGVLKEIYRILKPGGHLILETPRYDTLMFKLLGRRERSLSTNGHIYFFTTDSLRGACERAGFALKEINYVGRSLTLDRLAYNIGVISKSAAIQTKLKSLARAAGLHNIKLTLNLRDMQRVCVQKPIGHAY